MIELPGEDNTEAESSPASEEQDVAESSASEGDEPSGSSEDAQGEAGQSEEPPEKRPHPNTDFVLALSGLIQNSSEAAAIHILKAGLFVEEEKLDWIVERYSQWLDSQKTSGSAKKQLGALRAKLFCGEEPLVSYIFNGKQPIPGFLIPCPLPNPRDSKVRYYEGSPVDTKGYIHPKDPVLAGLSHLKADLTPTGLRFTVKAEDQQLSFSLEFVKSFAEWAGSLGRLRKRYPGLQRSLRKALKALDDTIHQLRPLDKRKFSFVPGQYRNPKMFRLCLLHGLVVVVKDTQLVDVYSLHSRKIQDLVLQEYQSLRKRLRGKRKLEEFQFGNSQRGTVGFVDIYIRKLSISLRALSHFVREYHPRYSDKDFPYHYTLQDVLPKFGALVAKSEPIEATALKEDIVATAGKGSIFRKNGPWIFVENRRALITHCFVLGKSTAEGKRSPKSSVPGKRREKRNRRGAKNKPKQSAQAQSAKPEPQTASPAVLTEKGIEDKPHH